MIKETFGVSFTSVLISSISAGILDAFKTKKFSIGKIPFLTPVPLPGHSLKLENHATGAVFKIPVNSKLTPSERLQMTEKLFQFGRRSTIPYLISILPKLMMSHVYPVARKLLTSKSSAGCSNFPGSAIPLVINGHKVLTKEFGVGVLRGGAGVVFSVLSYNGNIRIVVTGEEEALDKNEAKILLVSITEEIDKLYETVRTTMKSN